MRWRKERQAVNKQINTAVTGRVSVFCSTNTHSEALGSR